MAENDDYVFALEAATDRLSDVEEAMNLAAKQVWIHLPCYAIAVNKV